MKPDPDHVRRAARLLLRHGATQLLISSARHHHSPVPSLSLLNAAPFASIRALHAASKARRCSGSTSSSSTCAATASSTTTITTRRLTTSSSSAAPAQHRLAAPPPDAARAALEYCARLVRQHDPDSFAWAVLLPKEERARILALRALNVETLLVPASAGKRSAGEGAAAMLRIRYQWWRDAVRAAMDAPAVSERLQGGGVEDDDSGMEGDDDEDDDDEEEQAAAATTGGAKAPPVVSIGRRRRSRNPPPPPVPPAHPVITALWAARASAGPRLQRYPLRRLIDAREREALSAAAGEPPPLRLSDLEAHAEATHAQLLYAQLAAIGGEVDTGGAASASSAAADHAASHVGKAVGLAMALRGLPYAAAQRRCVLPLEVCASAGLAQEDLFRRAAAAEAGKMPSPEEWPPRADAALRDSTLEVASRAVGHLREARSLLVNGGKGQAHALLPAVAADLYLQALERTAQFDVFHPALRPPPPPPPAKKEGDGGGEGQAPPPLGAGLGVSPLRYLLTLRWRAWRGTF